MLEQLQQLRNANQTRQGAWPGSEGSADPLFRAVEFGGEAGEVLDAVKKYTRAARGISGNTGGDMDSLRTAIMEEMGDALISLDLLAAELGIDLAVCVPMKFNKTSKKAGIPIFMDVDTWEAFELEGLLHA